MVRGKNCDSSEIEVLAKAWAQRSVDQTMRTDEMRKVFKDSVARRLDAMVPMTFATKVGRIMINPQQALPNT